MTITFPLSLPASPGFSSFTMNPNPVVSNTSSPYTGEDYVLEWQGQWWIVDAGLPSLNEDDAGEWRGFIDKLNGMSGTFLMGDPTRAAPRGSAKTTPGTPLADGAGQTGTYFNIKGAPLSATGYLLRGDYLQLGSGSSSRLYRIMDPVNTDGAGKATVNLWPKITLAQSPADGATIVLSNTVGVFRLRGNNQPDTATPKPRYTRQLSAKSVV